MRTANPALNEKTFGSRTGARGLQGEGVMTLSGTVNKSALLVLITMIAASYTWSLYFQGATSLSPYIWGGIIGGLVVAMVIIFKPTMAPYLSWVYAGLEGLALGAISAMYESQFQGITIQAVGLTITTLFALLLVYKTGLIQVTQNFRMGVIAATGGIFLFYLVSIGLSFFGIGVPLIHDSGWLGIGFSLFVVGIAALNLVLDFDFIERGVERGAPKYMEWYGAFGLMVTLVWLYIEMLHLLAKLRR